MRQLSVIARAAGGIKTQSTEKGIRRWEGYFLYSSFLSRLTSKLAAHDDLYYGSFEHTTHILSLSLSLSIQRVHDNDEMVLIFFGLLARYVCVQREREEGEAKEVCLCVCVLSE